MKINLFLFGIITTFFFSCSNGNKQSDREVNGIKGNVKSILSIDYNAIDKFGQGNIVKERPKAFGTEYSQYDSLGNILEHKYYYFSKCQKQYESEDNKDGHCIKWISFDDDDDSQIKYGSEYKYDNKGNKILEIDIKNGSKDIIKNEYDENGRLILQREKYWDDSYKYTADGKIKEWINIYKGFSGKDKRHETYEYDEKGNRIKDIVIFTPKSEYERCVLYKYDNLNRKIDEIRINNSDANKGEVTQRVKYYYKNNLNFPYRMTIWGKNGDIEDETYTVWFSSDSDTLSIVNLNKNHCITAISNMYKKKDNIVTTDYIVESEIYSSDKYNYSNGILQSVIDKNGNVSSYVYDGNKLKEITRQFTDGKSITIYNKGLIQSITYYDKHSKIESEYIHEYRGDKDNGTHIIKFSDSEKQLSINELTFKSGKLVQTKNTQNGIIEIINYEYNEKGDLICSNNTSKGEKITYTYKYDPFDNWYYRIQSKNNKADIITERSIEYFTPQ